MSAGPVESSEPSSPSMSDTDRLIDFLRERDIPCPQCEYNLRGLTSARCPECGQGVQLAVTLVEPYLKAWITLLVPMCAGAGIGFLFLIAVMFGGGPGPPALAMLPMILYIAMIPGVLIVVRMRRRFMRLSRGRQWWLAVAAIGNFLLATGSFIFAIIYS